jgi:hypothetical protein
VSAPPACVCSSCPAHPAGVSAPPACRFYPSSSLTDAQWATTGPLLPAPGTPPGAAGGRRSIPAAWSWTRSSTWCGAGSHGGNSCRCALTCGDVSGWGQRAGLAITVRNRSTTTSLCCEEPRYTRATDCAGVIDCP